MYEDTVTVFNRRTEPDGRVLWYPTVIQGVHIDLAAGAGLARYGTKQTGRAAALIPYVRQEGAAAVAGKLYLPPKLWRRVEEPALYVTFADGEQFDFFICQSWETEEPVEDSSRPGGFYGALARERDDVFAVAAVCRYNALPHFEITGR